MTEQDMKSTKSDEQNQIESLPNGQLEEEGAKAIKNSSEVNYLHERLHRMQNVLLHDFSKRIDEEIEGVVHELRQHELLLNEFKAFATSHSDNTWSNRTAFTEGSKYFPTDSNENLSTTTEGARVHSKLSGKHKKQPRPLPEKVFVLRESYLTVLLDIAHIRTIYHIFLAIFLVLLLHSITYDYLAEGRIYFGLGTFKSSLEKIEYVFGVWLLEHAVVFLLYYAFKMWANVRVKLARQPALQSFWSHSCLITYICSQLLFGYVASVLCLKLKLTFITASILLLESTRFLMKMHSFVRTNVPRVLAGKLKSDTDPSETQGSKSTHAMHFPAFSSYIYFLFAPTLIYRDSYPRTSHIRWKFALARFMEIVATAFLYSYLFERHLQAQFANIGREELTTRSLIVKLYSLFFPNNVIFLCGFYLLLHSWLNFTAELLRFGDRMFYKDWWTSPDFTAYYRNWNVVVHDWLYEYIYKDAYYYLFKGSKTPALLMVFYTSAIVHEHIIGFALRLFLPVLFSFFGGFGVIMVFVTRKTTKGIGNFLVWFSLIVGNGLLFSLYSIEYYARLNCPRTYEGWADYLVPTVWTCYNR